VAKKPKQPDPVILPDLAVVSFGDMMTLMLTFFVLLFSMSEIKKPRIIATINNFRIRSGIMPFEKSPVQSFIPAPRLNQKQMRMLRGQTGAEPAERASDLDPQHLRFVFGGDEIFARGSARLTDRGRAKLAEFTGTVEGYKNIIEIRGHTEQRGLSPDGSVEDGHAPWILGFNRAYAVMRFLAERGIDERRFRLASDGDSRPADPRDPAKNRRVEAIMTQQLVRDDDG
jgi:chemotaxis protein MotB